MRLYRIRKLLDTDGCDDLVLSCDFKELLSQQVVLVRVDKLWNVLDYLQNVKLILLYRVAWQVGIVKFQPENVIR